MHPYSGFFVHKYRLVLTADENLSLPEFKGSALRGAFGHTLKRLACTSEGLTCTNCSERESCAYAVLFETTPPAWFPDAGKYSSFPRPYLINPPLSKQKEYRRGEALVFELVLVGNAYRYLHHVLACFHEIGSAGLRNGRGRFTISSVESVAADGSATAVIDGDLLLGFGQPITMMEIDEDHWEDGAVLVHFLTPARMDIDGRLQDVPLPFHLLLQGISRRIALLNALYCGGDAAAGTLGSEEWSVAKSVSLIDSATEWCELERYSSRQQTRMKQGGIVGSAIYRGPVGRFVPLLNIAQFINVGKSTTFGLGRVVVSLS